MLQIENLKKSYDGRYVLKDINLTLPSKGLIALTGESGSGKSTLLKCIGQTLLPDCGKIIFAGKDLTSLNTETRDKARGKIFTYIAQETVLPEDMAVEEGLSLFEKDKQKRLQALDRVGLLDKATEKARNLSGGERQRVAIARALLRDTPVVLCDEITSSLDDDNADVVMKAVSELSKDRLVICVGHKVNELLAIADGAIEIQNGTITKSTVASHDESEYHEDKVKISLGFVDTLKLYFSTFKTKAVRTVFAVVFVFIAMASFMFSTSLLIEDDTDVMRANAKNQGIILLSMANKDIATAYSVGVTSGMVNGWLIYADLDNGDFVLYDGGYPKRGKEVMIPLLMHRYDPDRYRVGMQINLDGKNIYTVCGIFETDTSAYDFEELKKEESYLYSVNATLFSYYASMDFYDEYRDSVSYVLTKENERVIRYNDEQIIAGKAPEENNQVLISTGSVAQKYGVSENEVVASADLYFDRAQKSVVLAGEKYSVSGICLSSYNGWLKKGDVSELASTLRYLAPVDDITAEDYRGVYNSSKLDNYSEEREEMTKICLILFAVFTVLSFVVFVNTNLFEKDERKTLFGSLREAGFTARSLTSYYVFSQAFTLLCSFILLLAAGVPTIIKFQTVKEALCYTEHLYLFSWWSVLAAFCAMAVVAAAAYAVTAIKTYKETSACLR